MDGWFSLCFLFLEEGAAAPAPCGASQHLTHRNGLRERKKERKKERQKGMNTSPQGVNVKQASNTVTQAE